MQSAHVVLRASCAAQNAFNASRALSSTFVWTCNPANGSRTQCQHAHAALQRPGNLDSRRAKYFSSHARLRQQPPEPILDEEAHPGHEERQVSDGGIYTNYDALNHNFGSSTVATPANLRDRPYVSQDGLQRDGGDEQALNADGTLGHRQTPQRPMMKVTRKTSRVRTYNNATSWQDDMREIAKLANEFSKTHHGSREEHRNRSLRLSYVGSVINPVERQSGNEMTLPWRLTVAQKSGKDPAEILAMEIDAFVNYIKPTPAEKAAREAVIAEANSFIAEHMSAEINSELFGSEKTGLALPTSDIDIRLWQMTFDSQKVISDMKSLLSAMENSNNYTDATYRSARYPLINAQHKQTGINIQIVFAPSTSEQRDMTVQYLNELPHLHALYMVLRTAFGMRGLHEVYNGGIGSYGLLIMIVASLKRRSTKPPITISDQLIQFLDFYANLNTFRRGVSLTPPKVFSKHTTFTAVKKHIEAARRRGDIIRAGRWAIGQTRPFQPYLLCLQDPANPLNDLGRKSNAIKHIRATIVAMRTTLHARMLGTSKSMLVPLVGRCHEVYHEGRKKVEEYGLQVLRSRKREEEASSATKEAVKQTAEASG